ncbi:MAG: hypothetical protein CVU61_17860 [Deltaproteobacteria bacterium HGW-Deltaproteobacteria-19]|nr:MAG: hypothetical protein CVU61_17860 [Deltaproteobacteria bacterium HGW-Deltaproteobacteria-19]
MFRKPHAHWPTMHPGAMGNPGGPIRSNRSAVNRTLAKSRHDSGIFAKEGLPEKGNGHGPSCEIKDDRPGGF